MPKHNEGMEVELPKKISLDWVKGIIAIILFLFGVLSGVLYMKWTGEQNSKDIQSISSTQKERIKIVDDRFQSINDNMNSLRVDLAEVKGDIKASQNNQNLIMGQITQLQTNMTALTAALVKEKMASYNMVTNPSY